MLVLVHAGAMLLGAFSRTLPRALAIIGARSLSILPKVKRTISVWSQRKIFPPEKITGFEEALDDPDSVLTGARWLKIFNIVDTLF